jgi:hypothetical protein
MFEMALGTQIIISGVKFENLKIFPAGQTWHTCKIAKQLVT